METIYNIIISGITSFGIIAIYLKYFASKSIEYYKKEYQKELQNYNLYILKRNEIYQESYAYLMDTYLSLPNYNGEINYPDFKGANLERIIYIFKSNFPKAKILPNNISDIKELNKLYYYLLCEEKYNKYLKYITKNLIYFDDKIDKKFEEINEKLSKLVNIYCVIRAINGGTANCEEDYKKEGLIRNNIEANFNELIELIRNNIYKK